MNNIPVQHPQQPMEACDSFSRVVYGLGMVLFIFGIFVPGAHTLMMVGLALLAVAWVVEW
jgi:hypothetical protein